ncbi:MAG: HAD family hydrolase [Pseudomonadota bacterium]
MIRIVCFDLDDTLWDSGPAIVRAESSMFEWLSDRVPAFSKIDTQIMRDRAMNIRMKRPDIAHDFTLTRLETLRSLLLEQEQDPGLADDAVAHFITERSRVDMYEETLSVLNELVGKYALVAVTNGNANLDTAGVAHLFDSYFSPSETGVQKPDPRMFGPIFDRYTAKVDEIVHVGDHPYHDVEAAHRASVRSVWLNREARAWPQEYQPPTREIKNLAELPGTLEKLVTGNS